MRIWIVVADERVALFYASLTAAGLRDAAAASPTAEHSFQLALKITNTHVQAAVGPEPSRPDAALQGGAGRSRLGERPPAEGLSESFAKRIAEEIERARHAGALDRVVLAAEPQLLGLIRAALPHATREAVAAEVAKNLVRTEGRALLEQVPIAALAKPVLRI